MLLLFAGGAQTRQVLADVVGANVPNPNDFGTYHSFALRPLRSSSSSSLSFFFRPPPPLNAHTFASRAGKTIRGTYGDYFKDRTGKVTLFQPAVVRRRHQNC
jgi:hypothetical protein